MEAYEEIYRALGAHSLPAWEELPDFELYMDQVLSLVGRYMRRQPGQEDRPLTSSMVNNYVKLKVLPPPVSKRYSRLHIALLLVICTLKPVAPIAALQVYLRELRDEAAVEQFYTLFCRLYGQTNREVEAQALAEQCDSRERILRAALRSQAEQSAALSLFAAEAGEKEA